MKDHARQKAYQRRKTGSQKNNNSNWTPCNCPIRTKYPSDNDCGINKQNQYDEIVGNQVDE
jgi:hypothetical protein